MGELVPIWLAPFLAACLVTVSQAAMANNVGVKELPTVAAAPKISSDVTLESVPDWVILRPLPKATQARIAAAGDGQVYLLNDSQLRGRFDGHDDWFRAAVRVVDRSGLESAGRIIIDFNPAFETVAVSFVHVIRNGKVLDRTGNTPFRIIAQESDLDEGIVSGGQKAVANIPDVRVGDVVDFAYVSHDSNRLWPGQIFQHYVERFTSPLAQQSLRYVWPVHLEPRYKLLNSNIVFTRRVGNGAVDWEWTAIDPPPLVTEDDAPNEAFQAGAVDISTMTSWGEVARWAAKLYDGDKTLTPGFAARVDAIAVSKSTQAERLTAAARLVQDTIRYVGEEMGEGSYIPRRPKTVIERGYGDCKDETLLLTVVLRRLGIDAVPALVSSTNGRSLPDRLPSPLVFDHVIVRATIDGQETWIDATGTHRGGQGLSIVPADYAWALPILPGQTKLERMTGADALAGEADVLEKFDIDESAPGALRLHVETTYTDARADWMRDRVANVGQVSVGKDNLAYYRKRFAGLTETKPVAFVDDRNSNIFKMIENYSLSREDFVNDKLPTKFITRAYLVTDVLPDRQDTPRRLPLAIFDHLKLSQVIEVNVAGRSLWVPEDVKATAGDMVFSRVSTRTDRGIRLTYTLDTGSRARVSAEDAKTIYAISDRIKDEAGLEFYFDKSTKTRDDPGFDQSLIKPLKADIDRIVALSGKGDEASLITALGLINDDIAKVKSPSPEAGLLEGLRGSILARLGRSGPALASLRSATEQYGGNPPVFRLRLAYELDANDPAAFNSALRRTLDAQKPIVTNLNEKWVQVAQQHIAQQPETERTALRDGLCTMLVEADWSLSPRTSLGNWMLGCALEAYAQRGDVTRARAMLALHPTAHTLVLAAMDKRDQALWPDLDRLESDGFEKALEREASDAGSAAKAAPKDYKAAMRFVVALRQLGRNDEALEFLRPLISDPVTVETQGEDAGWLVDQYARILQTQGKSDQAVAALDSLLKLGIENYPWLVSQAINRLGLLNDAGRHAEALASIAELEKPFDGKVSPYGRKWILAEKACALRALGRDAEAIPVEKGLVDDPSINPAAQMRAAACRGNVDAIAADLIARLKNKNERSDALALFISFGDPPSRLPFEAKTLAVMKRAIARPEVQAAFRAVGRNVRFAGSSAGWSTY